RHFSDDRYYRGLAQTDRLRSGKRGQNRAGKAGHRFSGPARFWGHLTSWRMNRVFGLETEYGITVNGAETVDVVAESIELVRRYTDHGALMKWDYELEDPHQDARGFRARELLQDTDESAYYEIDKNRPLSFEEIKSDLVLSN